MPEQETNDMEEENKRSTLELIFEILIGSITVIGYILYQVIVFILNVCIILLPLVAIIVASVFIAVLMLKRFGVM